MGLKRRVLCLILALSLLLPLGKPVSAAGTTDLIRQLILYYCHYQENARTDIMRLLAQMETEDPELADDWAQIMEQWHLACTELTVHPGILPDGLPEDHSLCIVVMGFALDYYGGMREELIGRLETVLASAKKYPNAYILCTGGGTAPGNQSVTEAGQMARWLQEHGISADRIIVENRSYSTELNARYSIDILRESYPDIQSLALISSDYHLRRCYWLFQSAIILAGMEDRCAVVSSASYAAGYVGESGFIAEAESMGNLYHLRLRNATPPPLSQLWVITASGDYQPETGLSLSVTAYYDTGFSRDVSKEATIAGFNPDLPGTQTITVSYTENDISKSVPLTLIVPEPPETVTEPETEATEETFVETSPLIHPQEEPVQQENCVYFLLIIPAAVILIGILIFFKTRKPKGKFRKRG